MSLDAASAVGHLFSIFEFDTPFAIAAVLLVTLKKSLLRAVFSKIIGDQNRDDNDSGVYNDLCVA